MPRIHTFTITPALPPQLEALFELGFDLAWTWVPEARELFERIDPGLWKALNHNPIALFGQVGAERLDALSADEDFVLELAHVVRRVAAERGAEHWFGQRYPELQQQGGLVAYFSAEYGLTEALPIYSGGLGVLSGDHLKSAAQLGVPLVAVGLGYQHGYFRQRLDHSGWQHEQPQTNDFWNLPMRPATAGEGRRLAVHVEIGERDVEILVWEVNVGRIQLYLLDTNSPANHPDDRRITAALYGGGSEDRLKQEIVLGVGGIRALDALGLRPTVFHMNEGHAAFMALERIHQARATRGLDFHTARELCAAGNVFTTHTPVPAGFDIFGADQLDRCLPSLHDRLGVSRTELLELGAHRDDPQLARGFNMAYLALRCAGWINGVSTLHGRVSRGMWRQLWPGAQRSEVPITSVTNGVHTRTWLSQQLGDLLTQELGPWERRCADPEYWAGVVDIDDRKLWQVHEDRRAALASFVRDRLRSTLDEANTPYAPPPRHRQRGEFRAALRLDGVLDPGALTVGFARRFATYKRATLLMRDPERLERLIANAQRPVQFVFAGKAHPRDVPGKELIKAIVQFSMRPRVRGRVVFIEEYDMGVARRLVQGVDVWLNTPRRPKEASGTSGMKVIMNGGLHLSVLDGWWAEAYTPEVGWSIGLGEIYGDPEQGDAVEAEMLMTLLEQRVVPEFYDRDADGLPRRWIDRMKASMSQLSARFSMDRQVIDYTERLYAPAHQASTELAADDHRLAHARAQRARRVRHHWRADVSVEDVQFSHPPQLRLGAEVRVDAQLRLGGLAPEDVQVELVTGPLDAAGAIVEGVVTPLAPAGPADAHGRTPYTGVWQPTHSGQRGTTVRVRPHLPAAPVRDLAVLTWE